MLTGGRRASEGARAAEADADPHGIGAVSPRLLRPGRVVDYYPVVHAAGKRMPPVRSVVCRSARDAGGGVWLVALDGFGEVGVQFVVPVAPAEDHDVRGGHDCLEHQWVETGLPDGRGHCAICHEPEPLAARPRPARPAPVVPASAPLPPRSRR